MDQKIEAKIEQLLSQMTLREKLGQLTQFETVKADRAEELKEQVRRGEVGSILMSVGSTAGNTPQGDIDISFYNELQRIAMEESKNKIPLLFGRDVIHGHKTVYPIPLAMAASFDYDLIKRCYREIAEEAANDSVHWSFAPMLDLARDPRWGRMIEGCGEDPYIGTQMAKAVVEGFQGDDLTDRDSVIACAKHFVGYGAAEGGRDYTHTEISDYSLYNYYLPAFHAAIDAGVKTVMASFNDINGEPVSGSSYYLKTILRDYLGFDGMVVSDYAAIRQLIRNGVAKDDADATVLALKAGIDIDMWDGCYLNEGEQLFADGRISMKAVDNAVRNVLRVKLEKGLFNTPYCERKEIDYAKHRQSARLLATKSAVLLKNENDLLPLQKDTSVLLVGGGALERRDLHGSWALDGKAEQTENFLEAMQKAVETNGKLQYDQNCQCVATDADVIVIAFCEPHHNTGENACVSHISLSEYEKDLITRIKALGKKTVGVFFYGRPIAMGGIAESFDAILYAWHGGCEVARAAADLLFGKVIPSGKTPVTFPRLATHLPLYYNCYSSGRDVNVYYGEHSAGAYKDGKATPYYPFGYGLSYAKFKYSNIHNDIPVLTVSELKNGKTFCISVDVENIGAYDADETVQLYICDKVASISRPMRELKAFSKQRIAKGHTVPFRFEIGKNSLGFYNKQGEFVLEAGEFDIYIGEHSLTDRYITICLKE